MIETMRAWVTYWLLRGEFIPTDIPDYQVIDLVDLMYDGGLLAFVRTCRLQLIDDEQDVTCSVE